MEKKEPAKPKGKAAAAKTFDKFTQVQTSPWNMPKIGFLMLSIPG